MGKTYDQIPPDLADFIGAQHVFFVATAPLAPDGHINLSPKGLDTFRILSPKQVAYADMTGSGNETSAHLAENGRVTFMFCSFDEHPTILRIYGKGRIILRSDSTWPPLLPLFEDHISLRQIVLV